MKIGIFGGSFDPIHTGHAVVADYIAQTGVVDEVWFMVSPQNPLKADHASNASQEHRLNMAILVASECKNVKASDFEFRFPSPSFSYRTLLRLQENYPEDEFWLIIGSDNWLLFDRWANYEDILRDFNVIVYPRPGYKVTDTHLPNVKVMDGCPQVLVSSTFIRDRLAENKRVRFLLPGKVENYIRQKGLYVKQKDS